MKDPILEANFDECCAPEMREIKGVWTPVHEEGCTRSNLDEANEGASDETDEVDGGGVVLAAGDFMDRFAEYRRDPLGALGEQHHLRQGDTGGDL